jgi:hypothetical protein
VSIAVGHDVILAGDRAVAEQAPNQHFLQHSLPSCRAFRRCFAGNLIGTIFLFMRPPQFLRWNESDDGASRSVADRAGDAVDDGDINPSSCSKGKTAHHGSVAVRCAPAIPSAPARIKRLVMACVYSGPDERYARRPLRNCIGAKPEASGTASRSLHRYMGISHSVIAEKSP